MTARSFSVKLEGALPVPPGNGGAEGPGDEDEVDGATVGGAGIDDMGSPVWGTDTPDIDVCGR